MLVGILVMSTGHLLVSKIIQDSMTLTPGSQLTHMWLQPPVQSRLTVFGFHVANSEEVLGGARPVLEEVGPFVYSSRIEKNSKDHQTGRDSLHYNQDGKTLTYRPRYIQYST